MRAGALRSLVGIEQLTGTQNAHGEPVDDWTTYETLWAEKEDGLGREVIGSQRTIAEGVTRFRVRFIDGVEPLMRVNCGGVFYDIVSVADPDGRRRTLVLDTVRKS